MVNGLTMTAYIKHSGFDIEQLKEPKDQYLLQEQMYPIKVTEGTGGTERTGGTEETEPHGRERVTSLYNDGQWYSLLLKDLRHGELMTADGAISQSNGTPCFVRVTKRDSDVNAAIAGETNKKFTFS